MAAPDHPMTEPLPDVFLDGEVVTREHNAFERVCNLPSVQPNDASPLNNNNGRSLPRHDLESFRGRLRALGLAEVDTSLEVHCAITRRAPDHQRRPNFMWSALGTCLFLGSLDEIGDATRRLRERAIDLVQEQARGNGRYSDWALEHFVNSTGDRLMKLKRYLEKVRINASENDVGDFLLAQAAADAVGIAIHIVCPRPDNFGEAVLLTLQSVDFPIPIRNVVVSFDGERFRILCAIPQIAGTDTAAGLGPQPYETRAASGSVTQRLRLVADDPQSEYPVEQLKERDGVEYGGVHYRLRKDPFDDNIFALWTRSSPIGGWEPTSVTHRENEGEEGMAASGGTAEPSGAAATGPALGHPLRPQRVLLGELSERLVELDALADFADGSEEDETQTILGRFGLTVRESQRSVDELRNQSERSNAIRIVLLGDNGAGKSTTVNALVEGTAHRSAKEAVGDAEHSICEIPYCPDEPERRLSNEFVRDDTAPNQNELLVDYGVVPTSDAMSATTATPIEATHGKEFQVSLSFHTVEKVEGLLRKLHELWDVFGGGDVDADRVSDEMERVGLTETDMFHLFFIVGIQPGADEPDCGFPGLLSAPKTALAVPRSLAGRLGKEVRHKLSGGWDACSAEVRKILCSAVVGSTSCHGILRRVHLTAPALRPGVVVVDIPGIASCDKYLYRVAMDALSEPCDICIVQVEKGAGLSPGVQLALEESRLVQRIMEPDDWRDARGRGPPSMLTFLPIDKLRGHSKQAPAYVQQLIAVQTNAKMGTWKTVLRKYATDAVRAGGEETDINALVDRGMAHVAFCACNVTGEGVEGAGPAQLIGQLNARIDAIRDEHFSDSRRRAAEVAASVIELAHEIRGLENVTKDEALTAAMRQKAARYPLRRPVEEQVANVVEEVFVKMTGKRDALAADFAGKCNETEFDKALEAQSKAQPQRYYLRPRSQTLLHDLKQTATAGSQLSKLLIGPLFRGFRLAIVTEVEAVARPCMTSAVTCVRTATLPLFESGDHGSMPAVEYVLALEKARFVNALEEEAKKQLGKLLDAVRSAAHKAESAAISRRLNKVQEDVVKAKLKSNQERINLLRSCCPKLAKDVVEDVVFAVREAISRWAVTCKHAFGCTVASVTNRFAGYRPENVIELRGVGAMDPISKVAPAVANILKELLARINVETIRRGRGEHGSDWPFVNGDVQETYNGLVDEWERRSRRAPARSESRSRRPPQGADGTPLRSRKRTHDEVHENGDDLADDSPVVAKRARNGVDESNVQETNEGDEPPMEVEEAPAVAAANRVDHAPDVDEWSCLHCHCRRNETPQIRAPFCNACGLYYRNKGVLRPQSIIDRYRRRVAAAAARS